MHKTTLHLDYISELRIHITLAIFKSVIIQSFQLNNINEKVYMCTSTVNNFSKHVSVDTDINPLNAKLNPICHLLTLLRAHPVLHVSRTRVKKVSSS
jgi:hypothetical protein